MSQKFYKEINLEEIKQHYSETIQVGMTQSLAPRNIYPNTG